MTDTTHDDRTDESTTDDVTGGPLHDLSIAPGSDEPAATRDHSTLWSVTWTEAEVALALTALDTAADTYTAIAKGYLSFEEARRLRDALDRALDADVRVPFAEIDGDGMFEQMAWLSDAADRLDAATPDRDDSAQREVGLWTGDVRACATCDASPPVVPVAEYDGTVYCDDHAPIGRCARCEDWTHETGLGSYPLCPGCQTERGGQTTAPLPDDGPDAGAQVTLSGTDGDGAGGRSDG